MKRKDTMMKMFNRMNVGRIMEKIVYVLECLASVFIVIVTLFLLVKLINVTVSEHTLFSMTSEQFSMLLGNILSLIVGLEFVKLLTRQRAIDFVEVLMLAISRQMVVEHLSMFQMLIGVGAIAGLFAIRKYLFTKNDIKEY